MEALVLIALVAGGHIINKNKDKNPIVSNVNDNIHHPNGENIYKNEYYEETDTQIKDLVTNNYKDSLIEGTNIINDKKLPREDMNNVDINQPLKENFSDQVYSTISGQMVNTNDFMRNDQGISAQPFIRNSNEMINIEDTRRLDQHQGDSNLRISKREAPPFFQWEKNDNVFGNQFGEYIGDKSRYNESKNKDNELPFEQIQVNHIDMKSDINREIKQIIADKTNIDSLRSKNDPKLTYEGRVISGKNINSNRGNIGSVMKYDPETFYENDKDRYFTTTGAYLNKSERPTEILPDTYRSTLNDQPLGNVSSNNNKGPKKQIYQEPLKIQHRTDTNRNTMVGEYAGDSDFNRAGYKSYPNERDITTERTHESNIKKEVSNHSIGLQDDIKKTIKETTIHSKNNGNLGNTVVNNTLGLLDNAKVTKKQTTINSKNNGYIKGNYQGLTNGYDSPELTTKDTLLKEYTGGASSAYFSGDMMKDNYMNAETNPTKEKIAIGREPTLSNTKVVNGAEHQPIDIKKLNMDYMNQSDNKLDKVYSSGPNMNQYDITTFKDKLDDSSISDRINKDLLDPFRKNPYTQSLSSFSY